MINNQILNISSQTDRDFLSSETGNRMLFPIPDYHQTQALIHISLFARDLYIEYLKTEKLIPGEGKKGDMLAIAKCLDF
jgi:hypothetical protein